MPNLRFQNLPKLRKGDKVAIVSPSFAAPAKWPHIHEIGLKRLRDDLGLEPIEYPTTRQLDAPAKDRARDLIAAFEDPEIKAVISTIGGDDQITYIKNLPTAPFRDNPKPFFGYSDNTHFANHLWLSGVPSYYGGCLFIQIARLPAPEPFTWHYLRKALFEEGELELTASSTFCDIYGSWEDPETITRPRDEEPNEGWHWDGSQSAAGVTWGGCLESVDELLRHNIAIPTLDQFKEVVLILETSEEIPTSEYVLRVIRAFGELGVLERVQGLLVGRPQAWSFEHRNPPDVKAAHRAKQRETILDEFRKYNPQAPVVQNLDLGHTNPQICLPFGRIVRIEAVERRIFAEF